VYNDTVYLYFEHKGSDFISLNRLLQQFLIAEFVMILIIFFNSEYLMLGGELPEKIILYVIMDCM